MLYVIAGNAREAHEWMRSRSLSPNKDATYVSNCGSLRGVSRGVLYVKVGTWYDRPDRVDIFDVLISREARCAMGAL